jgi:hypothetical protein
MSQSLFTTLAHEKQVEIAQKLMGMYRSSGRYHGWADATKMVYDESKHKWKYAKIFTLEGGATLELWLQHLRGEIALGLLPTLDNGRCYWGSIDIDKYDIDIVEVRNEALRVYPDLVPTKSKSSGLHLDVHFDPAGEGVDAARLMDVLGNRAVVLGFAGSEIFPRQASFAGPKDGGNWIFMPYGTPESCCINGSGGHLLVEEFVKVYSEKYSSPSILDEKLIKSNVVSFPDRTTKRKTAGGVWVAVGDDYDATVASTFEGAPICLLILTPGGVSDLRNNFLIHCAVFLKKKYSDNWEDALRWVNLRVLRPSGDPDKLKDVIQRLRVKEYNYTCHAEPMVSRCHSKACKSQKYGVGSDYGDPNRVDFAVTIVKTVPAIYYVSMRDSNNQEIRMQLAGDELIEQKRFRNKCLEYMVPFPDMFKRQEWDELIRRNLEGAAVVDAPALYASGINQLTMLETYLGMWIPMKVRAEGDAFLNGKGQKEDAVRMKIEEKRIYFKWKKLAAWCVRWGMLGRDMEKMKIWVNDNTEYHDRESLRDWYRSSYSVRFEQLDPVALDKWLNPDSEEDGKDK